MLSRFASNASLAKTRALFSRRLTRSDYTTLSEQKDVGQVAAYLRGHPGYADVLAGIDETRIHRAELEFLLRQKHFSSLESLCRFEVSLGEAFVNYILLSGEITLLLDAMTRIQSAAGAAQSPNIPPYMRRHIRIDTDALAAASNFGELVEAARGSVFYGELKKLPAAGTQSLMEFEIALYRGFYSDIVELADKKIGGKAGALLRRIVVSEIDLMNLIRLIRLRVYFEADDEYIRRALLPFGTMRARTVSRLLACKTEEEILSVAAKCGYEKPLRLLSGCALRDDLTQKFLFEMAMHNIRFSPYPPIVMVSYLRILSVEITNIIRIIEGIRYGIAPAEIQSMLVLSAKE